MIDVIHHTIHYFATSQPAITAPPVTTPLQPGQVQNLPQSHADATSFTIAKNIVFGTIGAFAFLMLTVSGLRYILSGGDPQKTARAKNGIIYSLVGLAVAITAEAIVGFIVSNI